MNGEPVAAMDHARRNRLIAIAAGVVTVIAIVLGFAEDFLGLPWHWMRPAAELLLLAELVGLVVLERHQLFEPVDENVGALRIDVRAIQTGVGTMQTSIDELRAIIAENARSSGQVIACTSTPEVFRAMTRVAREALARDQQTPQIFRVARLSGGLARGSPQEDPDLAAELRDWLNSITAYYLIPAVLRTRVPGAGRLSL
ncbi:MAG: hypothetical protein ACLQBA_14590 [Candidatus Binataceae bacterium]